MLKGQRITTDQFRDELRAVHPHLCLRSEYAGRVKFVRCLCMNCKSVFSAVARNLLKGSQPCPTCYDTRTGSNALGPRVDDYDFFLDAQFDFSITRVGPYLGANVAIEHKCRCGHVWTAAPSDIRKKQHAGCPACNRGNRQFSRAAIQWLETEMKNAGVFIQHFLNGGEFTIPGTRYRADGFCAETNTVYEFYGDVFHGNPKRFKPDDRPNYFRPEWTVRDLQNRLRQKEQTIRQLGFNLVTIWESEFNRRLPS